MIILNKLHDCFQLLYALLVIHKGRSIESGLICGCYNHSVANLWFYAKVNSDRQKKGFKATFAGPYATKAAGFTVYHFYGITSMEGLPPVVVSRLGLYLWSQVLDQTSLPPPLCPCVESLRGTPARTVQRYPLLSSTFGKNLYVHKTLVIIVCSILT